MARKGDKQPEKQNRANANDDVRGNLPDDAQRIYEEALQRAMDDYRSWGEEERKITAERVAWSAVREEYEKREDGTWHRRDSGTIEEG